MSKPCCVTFSSRKKAVRPRKHGDYVSRWTSDLTSDMVRQCHESMEKTIAATLRRYEMAGPDEEVEFDQVLKIDEKFPDTTYIGVKTKKTYRFPEKYVKIKEG